MGRKLLLASAALIAVFAASPAMAANLLTNGNFENTGFGGTTSYYNVGLDHAIPSDFGWSVPINNVDIVANGQYGPALSNGGNYVLDLVGYGSTGAISQLLTTTPGQLYRITLNYVGNSGTPGFTAGISANSAPVGTITSGSTWNTFTTTFTATSGSTLFQISEGIGGGNGGVFLDNIDVSAVPEPATWAMMLAGFGMIWFGLRSRRKQAVRVTYA